MAKAKLRLSKARKSRKLLMKKIYSMRQKKIVDSEISVEEPSICNLSSVRSGNDSSSSSSSDEDLSLDFNQDSLENVSLSESMCEENLQNMESDFEYSELECEMETKNKDAMFNEKEQEKLKKLYDLYFEESDDELEAEEFQDDGEFSVDSDYVPEISDDGERENDSEDDQYETLDEESGDKETEDEVASDIWYEYLKPIFNFNFDANNSGPKDIDTKNINIAGPSTQQQIPVRIVERVAANIEPSAANKEDTWSSILTVPIEEISPVPKGRFISRQGKRKPKTWQTSLVLTSTPNMEEIKLKNEPKAPPTNKKQKVTVKLFQEDSEEENVPNNFQDDDDDEDECPCIYCNDLFFTF
ncbi:hypothetical protein FQR65_LT17478 [Abscondita terminalis]|nr:hypothetical protein FQR65_LT17478 [Abscondita terminalis]